MMEYRIGGGGDLDARLWGGGGAFSSALLPSPSADCRSLAAVRAGTAPDQGANQRSKAPSRSARRTGLVR